MRHERILRQLFPLAVGLAIGAAAYLQMLGLAHVVDAAIRARARVPPSRIAEVRAPEPSPMADAAPILERNPFDSVTGPLDPRVLQAVMETGALRAEQACEDVHAVLIAATSDGASFAMLAGPRGDALLRREGDRFGDRAVTAIGWDRVWLARQGVRCEARLGGVGTTVVAQTPKPTPQPKANIDELVGIRQVGPTAYEIDRSVLDGALEDPRSTLGRAHVVPDHGRARLVGIRPDSRLAAMGLQNGDRLEKVNGMPLGTPEEALMAYARLRSSDRLKLTVLRGGKPMDLDYRVR